MQVIANVMHALGGSPAIGFELGLRYNIATFGLWGFTLRTCRSLRDAVQHAMRYLPLSTAYCQLSLIDNDTHFGVVLNGDTIPLERSIYCVNSVCQALACKPWSWTYCKPRSLRKARP